MISHKTKPNGHLPPVVSSFATIYRTVILLLPFIVVLAWLLSPYFYSKLKKAEVPAAGDGNSPPGAPRTTTSNSPHIPPSEPKVSDQDNTTPSPATTTEIELLRQQLAAMTTQRDEAIDQAEDISNDRDKFWLMLGTAQKGVKDSHVKVRLLNAEVNRLLASAVDAKARNKLLRDDMAADAELMKAEKQSLQDKINELSSEKCDLLKSAESASASLRNRVTTLETENRKLQHSGMEAQALETAKSGITALQTQVANLEAEYKKLQVANNKLSLDAEALEAQAKDLQNAIDGPSVEKTRLLQAAETKNTDLSKQVATLEAANKKLQGRNEKHLEDMMLLSTTSSSQIETLKTKNKGLQESVNMSTKVGNATSKELDDLEAKYSEANRQLKLTRELQRETQNHVSSLKGTLSSAEKDLAATQAILNLRDQDLHDSKQQHKLAQEQLAGFATAAQISTDEKQTADQSLKDATVMNERLRNKMKELENAPARVRKMLEKQVSQEQARIAKLEQELGVRNAAIRTRDMKIEELNQALGQCRDGAGLLAEGEKAASPADEDDGLDYLFNDPDEDGMVLE